MAEGRRLRRGRGGRPVGAATPWSPSAQFGQGVAAGPSSQVHNIILRKTMRPWPPTKSPWHHQNRDPDGRGWQGTIAEHRINRDMSRRRISQTMKQANARAARPVSTPRCSVLPPACATTARQDIPSTYNTRWHSIRQAVVLILVGAITFVEAGSNDPSLVELGIVLRSCGWRGEVRMRL